MIIEASKRFEANAIKRRNLKANGVSPANANDAAKTKNKVLAISEKINLSFLDGIRGREQGLNGQVNKAIEKQESRSEVFSEELKNLEAGNRKVPRGSCQQNGKALRLSYGVICLRSLDIAHYFNQGFYSHNNWQEVDFTEFLSTIQKPLLKGLTELTYDFPDYEPIVAFLLNTNEDLIKHDIEPESYEQLTRRLLTALRKAVAEYWTKDMEEAWERVLRESYIYLQKRKTAG